MPEHLKARKEEEPEALNARAKSLEFQLRSIYKISTTMLPLIRDELKQMIEAQVKLYLLYPNLPQSSAYINRLLKKIYKLGKDLPLHDLESRKLYISELESEIKTVNRTCNSPREQVELNNRHHQLTLLLEYNTQIVELYTLDFTAQEEPSMQFKAACFHANTVHAMFSQKLREYHEKNKLLKEAKKHDPVALLELEIPLSNTKNTLS